MRRWKLIEVQIKSEQQDRGIGPTYADKSQRNGIRIRDLLNEDRLRDVIEIPLKEKNGLLEKIYGINALW